MKKLFILIGLLITIVVQSQQTVTYSGTRIFTGELQIATGAQFNFKENYIVSIQTGDTIATIEAMRILLGNYLLESDTAQLVATKYGLALKLNRTDTVSLVGTKYDLTQKLGINATASNSNLLQGKDSTYIKANWGGSDEPLYEGDSAYIKENVRELLIRTDTAQELVSRTIYVSMPTDLQTPGSDVTGDGSISLPYATIEKAFFSLKKIISAAIIIQIDSGLFTISNKAYQYANDLNFNLPISAVPLTIQGNTRNVLTGLTMTVDPTNPFKWNVSGASWTANTYQNMFVQQGTSLYPIESNTTNQLVSTNTSAGTAIVETNTTISLGSGDLKFIINTKNTSFFPSILIKSVNFSGTQNLINYNNNAAIAMQFSQCKFIATNKIAVISSPGTRIYFRQCLFYTSYSSTTSNILDFQGNSNFVMQQCVLRNGTQSAIGFSISNFCSSQVSTNIFSNLYGLTCGGGPDFLFNSGGCFIKNCTNVFVTNTTSTRAAQFLFSFANNNTLYFENCTNLFYFSFKPYKVFFDNPNGITGITNIWNTSSLYKNTFLNENVGISINVPGTYPEYQQNQSVTLANNSTDSISIADLTYNRAIELKYTIQRGTNYRTGTCKVLNTGTAYLFDPGDYIESADIGVTLNGIYRSGGSNTLKLKWTTTNTGTACTFIYDAYRQNF